MVGGGTSVDRQWGFPFPCFRYPAPCSLVCLGQCWRKGRAKLPFQATEAGLLTLWNPVMFLSAE